MSDQTSNLQSELDALEPTTANRDRIETEYQNTLASSSRRNMAYYVWLLVVVLHACFLCMFVCFKVLLNIANSEQRAGEGIESAASLNWHEEVSECN